MPGFQEARDKISRQTICIYRKLARIPELERKETNPVWTKLINQLGELQGAREENFPAVPPSLESPTAQASRRAARGGGTFDRESKVR